MKRQRYDHQSMKGTGAKRRRLSRKKAKKRKAEIEPVAEMIRDVSFYTDIR